jgi:hypothetical protein
LSGSEDEAGRKSVKHYRAKDDQTTDGEQVLASGDSTKDRQEYQKQ